jgi:hypothetical protein
LKLFGLLQPVILIARRQVILLATLIFAIVALIIDLVDFVFNIVIEVIRWHFVDLLCGQPVDTILVLLLSVSFLFDLILCL